MIKNLAQQCWALLLLLAGLLVACEPSTSEFSEEIQRGELTKRFVKGSWTVDIDGSSDINAGTIVLDLYDKNSKLTMTMINLQNDSLEVVERPIKSWDIISNYEGFADMGLKGDALVITTADSSITCVLERFTSDSIITHTVMNISPENRLIGNITFVREDCPYNSAQEIKVDAKGAKIIAEGIKQSAIEEEYENEYNSFFGPFPYNGTLQGAQSAWMSRVGGNALVRNLAIPGTHDSSTNGVDFFVDFAALTQKLNINEQWDKGVRSFDLRVRDFDDGLELCHGPIPCNMQFEEAFRTIVHRVAGSSECAFVFINTEKNPLTNVHIKNSVYAFLMGAVKVRSNELNERVSRERTADIINSVLKQYTDEKGENRVLGYYRPDMTLDEARGKVFIINRLPSKDKGTFPFVGQGVVGSFSGTVDIVSDDTIKHPIIKNGMVINDLYAPDEDESENVFCNSKTLEFRKLAIQGFYQRAADRTQQLIFNSASCSFLDPLNGKKTELPNYADAARILYPGFMSIQRERRTCGLFIQDFAGSSEFRRMSLQKTFHSAMIALALPFTLIPWEMTAQVMLYITIGKGCTRSTKVYGDDLTNSTLNLNFIEVPMEDVYLNKRVIEGKPGHKETLSVIVVPCDAKNRKVVSWESDNPNVATVDNDGLLEIKNYGNALITVKMENGMQTTSYVVAAQRPMTAIDLGLSVEWANRNMGAASPENTGFYYAWGETELRDLYTPEKYKFGATPSEYISYCVRDNMTQLQPKDDAANVNLGHGWRMPTKEEVEELIRNCEISTAKRNGIDVLVVKRNGATMYLPKTAYRSGYDFITDDTPEGYFWTSDMTEETFTQNIKWEQAFCMYSEIVPQWYCGAMNMKRYYGLPIRPVRDKAGTTGYSSKRK